MTNPLRKIALKIKESAEQLRELQEKPEAPKRCTCKEYTDKYSYKDATEEPDFEADAEAGEGEASDEELNYRNEIIALIGSIFLACTQIVENDKLTSDQKFTKIEDLISKVNKEADSVVDTYTSKFFDKAISQANEDLKNIDKNIKKQIPGTGDLSTIRQQQKQSINDILSTLESKLTQGILQNDLNGLTRPDYVPDTTFINRAFNEAQGRLDKTGWYGWFKTNELGQFLTIELGAAILGDLIGDWVSIGDDKVCETCLDLEANSPYSIWSKPVEPHPWCRCEFTNLRLASLST